MIVHRPKANRDALTACALLGVFFVVVTIGAYLYTLDWNGAIPRDGSSLVVGRDFLNAWMYGRAALSSDPGAWYDPVAYQHVLGLLLGDHYSGQNWSYPPSLMLAMAPFGRLGYLPALALWTLLGAAIFLPTMWRYLGDRRALIAAMCAPAAVFGLISGQFAFITSAMMLTAFAWLDRRPVPSGILIGLLTIKPQLGVLFPVMLIASRRWRVFVTASATALALLGLSAAIFGVEPWLNYIHIGLPVQNIVLHDASGIGTPYFPTLFMNLRGIGLAYGAAMSLQVAVAGGAVAIVVCAFRSRADADPHLLAALFFACSVAAVPYMLSYDTLALCVCALALLANGALDARGRLMARLVYWLPLIQIALGTVHVPGPALIAPAFALYIFQRIRQPMPGTQPVLQRA
jgi:hypothetical protein